MVVLISIFLTANDVGHLFVYLSSYIFFSEVVKSFSHLKNGVAFLVVGFREFFMFWGYDVFIRYVICTYFPLVYGSSFYSLNSVF